MRYKPMLPTLSSTLPEGEEWYFEIKYDGFRCLLDISEKNIDLYSRNHRSFNESFPEIIEEAFNIQKNFGDDLPLLFDGELCILASDSKAEFSKIQKRGRLKDQRKIHQQQMKIPSTFLVFDLLHYRGKPLTDQMYIERKRHLQEWMDKHGFHKVSLENPARIQWIPNAADGESLFEEVKERHGEGVVAKRGKSLWVPGKRTNEWLKVKRFYTGCFIVTGYDEKNGYLDVAVLYGDELMPLGVFSHGLEGKERNAIIQIIKANQTRKTGTLIEIAPRICVEIEFLEIYQNQLRQPRFVQFRFDTHWEDCTWQTLQKQMVN